MSGAQAATGVTQGSLKLISSPSQRWLALIIGNGRRLRRTLAFNVLALAVAARATHRDRSQKKERVGLKRKLAISLAFVIGSGARRRAPAYGIQHLTRRTLCDAQKCAL